MQRILIIDDERDVRDSVKGVLDLAGYEAVTAENATDALEQLGRTPTDLVITDIIMPEKEGIETIRDIRDACPGAKIIAISGGGRIGNTDFLRIARQLGASDVIAKPLDPDHFINIVRERLAA